MGKPGDLSDLQINSKATTSRSESRSTDARRKNRSSEPQEKDVPALIGKNFLVKPEAAQMFNVLAAESGYGKSAGPELMAEALNMLFKKYGKPQIA